MFVAKVTGSLVATQKVEAMVGHKLLVVEPYRVEPDERKRLVTTGRTFVAVDTVGAGEGELRADHARLERPADAGNQEPADRRGHHRHRRSRCTSIRHACIRSEDVTISRPRPHSSLDRLSMQVNEELIRSVVAQVLAEVGRGAGCRSPASRYAGRYGVFTCVDEAVAAATRGLRAASASATIEDRKRIIDHIRRISIDQCVELGTMEMEETKIGRLEHKIEKLKTLGERTPGVEFLRSEVFSGDHGLAVIEHAPFGVIGAITPVTHSLPTITGNAVSMIAGGNTLVVNPHPSGKRVAAEGVRRFNRGDLPRPGHRQPDLRHRRADAGIGRRDLRASRRQADLRHRRPGRGPGGAEQSASGRSSPGRAIRRSSSMKRPISTAPPGAIIQGGAYDNNLLCIAEKEVFVVASVFDAMMAGDGAGRRGAAERPRGRRADEGRDRPGRRRRAQARRAGQGLPRPGRGRAGQGGRQERARRRPSCSSARPTRRTRSCPSSR